MAEIKGTEGLSDSELAHLVHNGGRFVVYQYAISLLIITFKRGSAVHFIRPGESAFTPGLPYTLLTLVAGWWGFPWGPIYSVMALVTNLGGGKDVTSHFRRGA